MTLIKHRATEFNQLLIADKTWDRRGRGTILNFIQCCKHEIKDMLKELNLEEMHKMTKQICDEEIDNTIYVNAREGVTEIQPLVSNAPAPSKSAKTGTGSSGADTKRAILPNKDFVIQKNTVTTTQS